MTIDGLGAWLKHATATTLPGMSMRFSIVPTRKLLRHRLGIGTQKRALDTKALLWECLGDENNSNKKISSWWPPGRCNGHQRQTACPSRHDSRAVSRNTEGAIVKNKAASALGKLAKGKPKNLTEWEIARRTRRLAEARKKRWPKKGTE
jgi:hypothetical protein